jgi:DNA topoisomerase III
MSKTLVIAEKPSVARDLASALGTLPQVGKLKSEKETFENENFIITSALGHLVELSLPQSDGKKLPWGIDRLPLLPDEFDLQPIEKTKERFRLLKKLMKQSDVSLIVNACDAGREGELIFRYVMEAAGVTKPTKRMWMQSMTRQSILDAWKQLRSGDEMKPLADAAKCRSESDWLVGINGTRAMTAFFSRYGGFLLSPVGRVQTPTLTILAKREREIQGFVSKTYYEVAADWRVKAGEYTSLWINENFRKGDDAELKPERLWKREDAEAIVARAEGKNGVVEETSKPTRQIAPLLYDLTSLQREAANRFGFSAKMTLQIAQALYEKHKVLTYPRTDSRFLPEDYPSEVKRILGSIQSKSSAFGDLGSFAADILQRNAVNPGYRRVFDNKKVSDHFAIIPTGEAPKGLSDAEAKLFHFVAQRFLAVFFPAAEFLVTERITRVANDAFRTRGKVLQVPGWLAVYGKEAVVAMEGEDAATAALVAVAAGEAARNIRMEAAEKQTKPPPRFTEATLLSAMEGAGKLVEDEELREAMAERGLGTPATRAAIIEGLIMDKYLQRDARNLVATAKALNLVDELTSLGADVLCHPELTGDWEYKLKEMEHGRLSRDSFMKDIRGLTMELVEKIRKHMQTKIAEPGPDVAVACPLCGTSPIKQTDAHYSCSNPACRFRIGKHIAQRLLTEDEAILLIGKRETGVFEGFRNRFGKEFNAALRLEESAKGDNLKVAFVFNDNAGDGEPATPPTLDDPLCPCPACAAAGRNGTIYVTADQYVCSEHLKNRKTCNASLPKNMCKFDIPRDEALRFFQEGRTNVIPKFISKKGRPFSAILVFQPEGKKSIEWEFAPREGAKKSTAKPSASGAAAPKKTTKKATSRPTKTAR